MHKRVKIDAPAKINLSFAITGKRPDGYHLVDSVMQTVTLYDTSTFSMRLAHRMAHCQLKSKRGYPNRLDWEVAAPMPLACWQDFTHCWR